MWDEHRTRRSQEVTPAFLVGTVVQLKSGGPAMVISGFTRSGDSVVYHCKWFDSTDKLHDGRIEEACLRRKDG